MASSKSQAPTSREAVSADRPTRDAVASLLDDVAPLRALLRDGSLTGLWRASEAFAVARPWLEPRLAELGALLLDRMDRATLEATLRGAQVSSVPAASALEPEPAREPEPESAPATAPTVRPVEVLAAPAALTGKVVRAEPAALTPEVALAVQTALVASPLRAAPTPPAPADPSRAASEALLRWGHTPKLSVRKEVRAEVDRIAALTPGEAELWSLAGKEFDLAMTAWLTTRARAAQLAAGRTKPAVECDALAPIFRHLTLHSSRAQPGFVNGLQQKHTPVGATWTVDAQRHEASLAQLAEADEASPEKRRAREDDALRQLEALIRAGVPTPQVKAAIKHALDVGVSSTHKRLVHAARGVVGQLTEPEFAALARAVGDEVPDRDRPAAPPAGEVGELADWHGRTFCHGRVVVIVGGDARNERLPALRETFGFAEVTWLAKTDGGTRQVDDVVRRMRSGTVGLVVILRKFVSHKISDKLTAARTAACPVVLANSPTVLGLRTALENVAKPGGRRAGVTPGRASN